MRPIDIAPMANLYNQNGNLLVLDATNNSKVTNAVTPIIFIEALHGNTQTAWVRGTYQFLQVVKDTFSVNFIDFFKLFSGCRMQDYLPRFSHFLRLRASHQYLGPFDRCGCSSHRQKQRQRNPLRPLKFVQYLCAHSNSGSDWFFGRAISSVFQSKDQGVQQRSWEATV